MKKSFVMYDEWGTLFDSLSADKAGELIKAIYDYQRGSEPTVTDPVLQAVFRMIYERMEADRAKYEETCRKRTEAGQRGGEAKTSKSKQMLASASKSKQNVPDNDNENDIKEKVLSKDSTKKKGAFAPPSVDEVREYCRERQNNVDAEAFVAFYESKGWKVGNQPMRSWKSAIITWEKRREWPASQPRSGTNRFHNFHQREQTREEGVSLERQLLAAQRE